MKIPNEIDFRVNEYGMQYFVIRNKDRLLFDREDNGEPTVEQLRRFASQFTLSEWEILTTNSNFKKAFLLNLKEAKGIADKLLNKKNPEKTQKLIGPVK